MQLHVNHLRDVFVEFCHQGHLSVRVEEGSGLTPDMSHSRPADVLVQNWVGGKPAAFHFTVTSPLTPKTLGQSRTHSGFAAEVAELHKPRATMLSALSLAGVVFP